MAKTDAVSKALARARAAIATVENAEQPTQRGITASYWIPSDAAPREVDTLQRAAIAEANTQRALAIANAERAARDTAERRAAPFNRSGSDDLVARLAAYIAEGHDPAARGFMTIAEIDLKKRRKYITEALRALGYTLQGKSWRR